MDFDHILQHSEYSTQEDVVGLSVYYYEEFKEQQEVKRADIITVIQTSRETVPKENISSYLRRLKEQGLLTTGSDAYRLTLKGLEHFKGLVDSDIITEQREGEFIDSDIADGYFYEQLVDDINICYRVKVNDAVLVLTRKLFENLLVDILRGHYGKQNVELYFDINRGYHYGLSELIKNLRGNIDEFRIYSRDIDTELLGELEEFKEKGDAGAHSITVDVGDETIEEMSRDATQLFEILYDLQQGVEIANTDSKD